MPEKVPLWIIRNTFCPYGSRMPQRPATMGPDLKVCKTCSKEMTRYQEWNWCDQEYYCNEHIEAARKADREAWRQKYGQGVPGTVSTGFRGWREDREDSEGMGFEYMESFGARAVPRTEGEVPVGNLVETDYAFWIGSVQKFAAGGKSLRSVCRGCNQIVFGDTARTEHKAKSAGFYKGGLSCPKVLMLSYQQLLKTDECLVCRSKCYGKQKWGVPLCCPNCIKIWKFDETMQYDALERTMMQYWVALDETRTVTGGSSISESSSSQTPIVSPGDTQE